MTTACIARILRVSFLFAGWTGFLLTAVSCGANDSYFWVVTNFGGMKAEDGYKTQTMCTLLMGIASIVFIWIISLFCH